MSIYNNLIKLTYLNFIEKIFKKMGFLIHKQDIDAVIACVPEAVEKVMKVLKY